MATHKERKRRRKQIDAAEEGNNHRVRGVIPNMEWMKKSIDIVPPAQVPLTENPFLRLEKQPIGKSVISRTQTNDGGGEKSERAK